MTASPLAREALHLDGGRPGALAVLRDVGASAGASRRGGGTMTRTGRRDVVWRRACALVALAVALASPAKAKAAGEKGALEPGQIRVVQLALQDRGLNVAVTGSWSERTREAVATFQRRNGLPATGAVDDATALSLGVDPYELVPVASKLAEAVRAADPSVNCAINTTVDCRPGA
jgi:peptidoglycan hydrolase-like protein with peptidoglycan-binding domain